MTAKGLDRRSWNQHRFRRVPDPERATSGGERPILVTCGAKCLGDPRFFDLSANRNLFGAEIDCYLRLRVHALYGLLNRPSAMATGHLGNVITLHVHLPCV